MPSSYSSNLRLEIQANGENASTWGTKTNNNLEMIEDAITGMSTLNTTGGDYTLSQNNAAADESRNAILKVTGALVSTANIIVPNATKLYFVWNATSGNYNVVVKTAAGTGVVIPQGYSGIALCDGTNVRYGSEIAPREDNSALAYAIALG